MSGALANPVTGTLADTISWGRVCEPDARTQSIWQDLVTGTAADPDLTHLSSMLARPNVAAVITALLAGSPYLQGLIVRDGARLQRLLTAQPDQRLAALVEGLQSGMALAADIPQAMVLLRRFKAEVALLCALADLGGVWPVMTVTDALTQAADAAVQTAVRVLFRFAQTRGHWHPDRVDAGEIGSGYIVLGMGKYGAFELNYSSDIDLIVFYDADIAAPRVSAPAGTADFFVRLTRDLVRLLSERTADGYVFRTDLRLRPDAGATQIALTRDAALHYYESVGQNWERAALIKARAVAGDLTAGRALLAELSPFIWRKYLDFAAIADIHAMKRQIHVHRGFGGIGVAGHDIKLGPGGIREIEFFVQTQQLIAGGRQSGLRLPRTLDAMAALVARRWITSDVANALGEAYRFLRGIEHRLQMVADEQTHELPTDKGELERFARFAGFADLEAFSTALVAVLTTVQLHYARLFVTAPALTSGTTNMVFAGEADDPATVAALAAMGFSQPSQVLATVRGWHHGRYRSMRSAPSRERLTQVQPRLIEALGATADPDQAFANFDRFLADLPSGVQLFALLRAQPSLLQLLADIMGSAPRLARILSRRRRLFDAVLDPRLATERPQAADYAQLLEEAIPQVCDFETVLDTARIVGSEQSFLIGMRILAGTLSAADAGEAYAALAQTLITTLHARITQDMAHVHGGFGPPDAAAPGASAGASVIIALGKFGGREMTAASDLDLIVVYDAPDDALSGSRLSDGAKPLSASQYYARLTQRLVAALSAPTTQGTLYEVDLRLRPSGNKGPLAVSLPGFVEYQARDAWTWEHMALTRARVVAGDATLRAKVERAIGTVLTRTRDRTKIAADVREMRTRISAEKGTTNVWDLKQVRGGLVDIEFIAQFMQLVHAADHPRVLDPNTVGALRRLRQARLLTHGDAETLVQAARLTANLMGVQRLMTDDPFDAQHAPRGLVDRLARVAHEPDLSALEARLRDTQASVQTVFDRLI